MSFNCHMLYWIHLWCWELNFEKKKFGIYALKLLSSGPRCRRCCRPETWQSHGWNRWAAQNLAWSRCCSRRRILKKKKTQVKQWQISSNPGSTALIFLHSVMNWTKSENLLWMPPLLTQRLPCCNPWHWNKRLLRTLPSGQLCRHRLPLIAHEQLLVPVHLLCCDKRSVKYNSQTFAV